MEEQSRNVPEVVEQLENILEANPQGAGDQDAAGDPAPPSRSVPVFPVHRAPWRSPPAQTSLAKLLPRVLDGALTLVGADQGDIWLVDGATGALHMVTYAGFDRDLVGHVLDLATDGSPRARAVRQHRQVVIVDVDADDDTGPPQQGAPAVEFRAIQATPIVSSRGKVVGVLSTQHRRPLLPPTEDLRLLEVYAGLIGVELDRLPDAWSAGDASAEVPPALRWTPSPHGTSRPARPLGATGVPSDTLGELAEYLVTGLFSVGLRLDSARSMLDDGPVAERLAAASRDIDTMIRRVRAILTDGGPGAAPTDD